MKNFNENQLTSYDNMFANVPDNIVVCIDERNTKILSKLPNINCRTIDCSDDWKLKQKKIISNNNCIDNCNTINKYEDNGKCVENCPNGDYFDDNNINKCKCELEKCLSCPPVALKNHLCSECNNSYYPMENDESNIGEYINCYKEPKGYYLDKNDSLYKKCYNSCETCEIEGNNITHNCLTCQFNFSIYININNYINCYPSCNYYYYFDSEYNFHCTNNLSCPKEYPLLKQDKNECIIFTSENFETENIFISNITNPENPLNVSIPLNDDIILINSILSAYLPEVNKSIILQRSDKVIVHFTNSKNELELLKNINNNNNNLSIIDLGECEMLLRHAYHINENDSLIFIKQEKISNKASEKNINFDVYEPYNKTKLNLSLCDGTPINIFVPMELNEENKKIYEKMKESGYDMFNINDPFYQDICTTFDSSDGTDILLTDRINYIYNNEDTQCQQNCQLSFYSIESKYMNCSCHINENNNNKNNNKEEKFTAKKIYKMIYDVLKYSNYNIIIKCFTKILYKNIFKNNIGNIIVIIYFSIYLIFFFIYFIQGINQLKIKLKNEINKINGKNSFNNNKKISDFMNFLNSPIKRNSNTKLIMKDNKINNKRLNFSIKNNTKKRGSSNLSSRNKILDFSRLEKLDSIKPKNDNKINKNVIKNNNTKKYDDFELNELEYFQAIKFDKRPLFQIYLATLKREHLLIFTFFNCNDYNLLSIKISRFIFLIVGDMALNVFFFSDDSMHKLFINYGKYDFFQQIPQITYSTIISQLIEIFLCFLSLTDKYIYKIKSFLISGKLNKIREIIRIIRIKLFIFFLFTFILFFVYWYIITVFCAVYRNTQIIFIKDSLISFSISMAYPFVIYFITSIFRICALRSSKKNLKCLYKLSDIIPFF